MKFIITADDYGVSPIIDDAIAAAVAAGYVTNVAGFANGRDGAGRFTVQKLKALKERFGARVSVGCHFTLTSGRAVQGRAATLTRRLWKRRHFRNMVTLEPADIDLAALRAELEAQVGVFEAAGLAIDHFSDHIGVLTLLDRTAQVYYEVVQTYNARHGVAAAVRNPVLSALRFEEGCLSSSRMLTLGRLGGAVKREVSVTRAELEARLATLQGMGLRTTDYFVEHLWNSPEPETLACILKYEGYSQNEQVQARVQAAPVAEVVTHLSIPPADPVTRGYQKMVRKLDRFGGVSMIYLKSTRAGEYEMMMREMPQYLADPAVELVTF